MDRSVTSRLVGTLLALSSVLTLGLGAVSGGHHSAHHASAPGPSATRDRGWCC
jgi:hypothetical protein